MAVKISSNQNRKNQKDSCFLGEDYNGTGVMNAKRNGLPGRLRSLLNWQKRIRRNSIHDTMPSRSADGSFESRGSEHEAPFALTRSTQAVGNQALGTVGGQAIAVRYVSMPRRVLWIDGIGGFLCCDTDEVVIGQAVVAASQILESSVTSVVRRPPFVAVAGDYLLQPLQQMWLNDAPVERAQLLRDGSVLQLGRRVRVGFAKPNPLSANRPSEFAQLE